MTNIQNDLFALADPAYRDFQAKLMPTIPRETVIGVRTPTLRAYAKRICGSTEAEAFLCDLPHTYYEENNLHGFLLEGIRDFDEALAALERFLPYIDNWATCDTTSPKAFAKAPERLLSPIECWIASGKTYTIRYGIGMLMRYFLDARFSPCYLEKVAAVDSEEYYVRMMQAWYFATALAKQYAAALPYIEGDALEPWTRRKAIQKAMESYRIPKEHKAYLKSLR